jgi:preprotein translocase subunit SecA
MSKLRTAFNRLRGVPVETDLAAYQKTARSIRAAHEGDGLAAVADAEIGRRAAALRRAPENGDTRAAVFALALEAARRAIGLAAHDVQLVAALAMADGRIAELPTGEGKTLAAVFTAASFAFRGRPVHVLTFNDYLARRDAAWMGPAYRLLGLSVGGVQEGQDRAAKRTAYACDVVYATAK